MDLQNYENKKEVEYENQKTMKLLWISKDVLKKLLLEKTHSELRTWLDIDDVLFRKHELGNKNILV